MKKFIYNLYRLEYRFADIFRQKKPVDLMLELSSKCNQVCTYCYHSEKNKKNMPFGLGFMDKNLALEVIRQGALLNTRSIKFNFRGESTLHPDYREILEYAKKQSGLLTYIDRIANTNFKIPKSKRDEIFSALENLTKVKISFDSFDKSVFETQRAGGSHELALENIDLFYKRIKEKNLNVKIVIQAVRTQLNKDEDIIGIAQKRWPGVEVSVRDMVKGRISKDLEKLNVKERDFSKRKTCLQAHARLVVLYNGFVQVCCPDIKSQLIIGNAKKQNIFSIFNSKRAKHIRKSLLDKSIFKNDPCKSCSSYESFEGYKHPKDS